MATTRKFGIITDISGITGGIMVNSLDFSENCETISARDEQGKVCDIAGVSNSKSVTITGLMDTAKGDIATAGSKITLDSKDWLIESVSRKESNSGWVELTISAKTADSAIITIIGGTAGSSSASE